MDNINSNNGDTQSIQEDKIEHTDHISTSLTNREDSTLDTPIDHSKQMYSSLKDNITINIDSHISFFVDEIGEFKGPISEGTTSIIIFAADEEDLRHEEVGGAVAIRIPRMLQLEQLLNFHIAEIAYHEGQQVRLLPEYPFLQSGRPLNTRVPNNSVTIPGTSTNSCFLGFYLSANSDYRIALLAEDTAWPDDFAKYLERKEISISHLYNYIRITNKQNQYGTLENLIFLPDDRKRGIDSNLETEVVESDFDSEIRDELEKNGISIQSALEGKIHTLGRKSIEKTWEKKDIGGWWFNMPAYIYSWMSADLERLLTGLVENDYPTSDKQSLASWAPVDWIDLYRNLAFGLNELHNKGFIHGDVRPANIMAKLTNEARLGPDHFRWIDVGLGYGHQLEERLRRRKNEEFSSIPPSPLGGGRVTPFYAPERIESLEFEDADLIRLEKYDEDEYKVQFFWKRRTYEEPELLRLKNEKNVPLRELGSLQQKDRIQLREFIFDIQRVEEDHIIVNKIYEIAMDKVLIDHSKEYVDDIIITKLKNVAISRYRIYKQWSEATDVYGLGILVLYCFFLRGIFVSHKLSSEDHGTNQIDRSIRDNIFQSLVSLLGNKSFLKAFIAILEDAEFELSSEGWNKDIIRAEEGDLDNNDDSKPNMYSQLEKGALGRSDTP